jgi:uncharacterized protein (DUF1697 family)
MTQYVAFLRGINLGRRTIKMDALRGVFDAQGFKDVHTLLASGNVVFESKSGSPTVVRAKIEAAIEKAFGFKVPVILRSAGEIRALIDEQPFSGVKLTPKTRLYITFLSEPPTSKLITVQNPRGSGSGIRAVTKGHIVSVLDAKDSTPDHMTFLSKEFGADITTRNWNTVLKVHALMQGK